MTSDCGGCGKPRGDGFLPDVLHCESCPPWKCDTCGEMDSVASPCGCWTSLEGMPLADIKAIFACDGGFQLNHKIGLPDGE